MKWLYSGCAILAALVWGSGLTTAVDQDFAAATPDFTARTADGTTWKGEKGTIDIRPELPDGTPAVAEIAFAVTDAKGRILGVRVEIDPARLLDSSQPEWTVSLDYVPSTKLGYGVLAYAPNPSTAPRTASKGALTGRHQGTILQGSFTSNATSIAEGTFEGAYRLRCWSVGPGVSTSEAGPGGHVTGGYAMVEDSGFSTPFCSQFRGLEVLAVL
jgi:hypothetical protein